MAAPWKGHGGVGLLPKEAPRKFPMKGLRVQGRTTEATWMERARRYGPRSWSVSV